MLLTLHRMIQDMVQAGATLIADGCTRRQLCCPLLTRCWEMPATGRVHHGSLLLLASDMVKCAITRRVELHQVLRCPEHDRLTASAKPSTRPQMSLHRHWRQWVVKLPQVLGAAFSDFVPVSGHLHTRITRKGPHTCDQKIAQ